MDNYYIRYTFTNFDLNKPGTVITIESKNYPYQATARGDVLYAVQDGGIWEKNRFYPMSSLLYADILIRKVEE